MFSVVHHSRDPRAVYVNVIISAPSLENVVARACRSMSEINSGCRSENERLDKHGALFPSQIFRRRWSATRKNPTLAFYCGCARARRMRWPRRAFKERSPLLHLRRRSVARRASSREDCFAVRTILGAKSEQSRSAWFLRSLSDVPFVGAADQTILDSRIFGWTRTRSCCVFLSVERK